MDHADDELRECEDRLSSLFSDCPANEFKTHLWNEDTGVCEHCRARFPYADQ